PVLPLDIRIEVPTPTSSGGTRVWEAARNARTDLTAPDGTVLAPKSQLWASHHLDTLIRTGSGSKC
ncbi:hypothetical protein, partial [Streptomyces sp. MBT60]|uniref:hypothetical protein n=1 Tax=Streptomyces sp. MBT60 TaxID=2800409 RepID=UPI001F364E9A